MITYKQLSLADIYSDCQDKLENDKPAFLSLLENHIDLDEIIPISFRNHFYASTGRSRKYPLHAMLWALIIQCIFSIPTDQFFVGCIWRVEHTGTNMNLLMTHQSPFRIVLSKYVVTCFITTLSLIWIMALYVISGLIAHVDGSIPPELPGWILLGTIGIYSICAFQIFISLIIRNFVVPVIIGFIGGLSGVGFVAKGIPYFNPYSLFDLAMNQRQLGSANIILFILISMSFIIGFLSLSMIYLYHSDVRSH